MAKKTLNSGLLSFVAFVILIFVSAYIFFTGILPQIICACRNIPHKSVIFLLILALGMLTSGLMRNQMNGNKKK